MTEAATDAAPDVHDVRGSVPSVPTDKPSTETGGRRIRGLDADQRRLARRQALLDAGLELFATQGFPGTTIEQLCQQAYVGTKAFYEAFETRDDLYAALLAQITESTFDRLSSADLADEGADERSIARRLLTEFAHAFVDDVRVAKVTFGEGSAITPGAERQRRANRRTAALFVEDIWRRYQPELDAASHQVAIGLIGGLFDIIADWVLDRPGSDPDPADVDELVAGLLAFYFAVRHQHLA